MWIRSDLKSRAKSVLRGRYWISFAVALVAGMLTGSNSPMTFNFNFNNIHSGDFNWDQFQSGNWSDYLELFRSKAFTAILVIFVTLFSVAFLIGIAYRIFVASVIEAGRCRWFSRSRDSGAVPRFSQMFSLFKGGSYMKTAGGMAWRYLFLSLWSLLSMPYVFMLFIGLSAASLLAAETFLNTFMGNFNIIGNYLKPLILWFAPFVPAAAILAAVLYGVYLIKYYSYRMGPWILADNPAIGYRRALKLSIDLARGHKWHMFVLDLSFIGWFLLGIISCCVGLVFVQPYYQAVQAELYAALRQDGVARGLCTMEEFGYIKADLPAV
jgi:uncharacterized membrane protein